MYYDDDLFRNRILNKIFNACKQVRLNLSFRDKIIDTSVLGNVHTLNLCYCDNIIDISSLTKVHKLDLSYCDKITDISAIKFK
jgi:hypothetical protein